MIALLFYQVVNLIADLVTLVAFQRLHHLLRAGMLPLIGLICYLLSRLILIHVSLCWWLRQRPAGLQGVGFGVGCPRLQVHREHQCKLRPEDLG